MSWLNEGFWLELREEESLHIWKKGQTIWGEKKHVVILHMKKTRRAKALPELNPAATVKDNKKRVFIEQQQKEN